MSFLKLILMKNVILACLVVSVAFIACNSDSGQNQSGEAAEVASSTIDPKTIQLVCVAAEEPNMEADAPQHEVFFQMGDKKVKVADILNCTPLTPDLYDSYQIPAGALSAVLGWWAGGGDLIYVVQEGENFVVKQGYVDEGMENNDFGYKTVLKFSKEGKEL